MRVHETLGAAILAIPFAVAMTSGCGGANGYLWIDEIPPGEIAGPTAGDYVIGRGDLLSVRVYNQDAISTRGRVLPDGRIAVPLVGELDAAGRRPADLSREIEARLKPFVVAPAVVVAVEEPRPVRIAVLGEVAHPGVFTLEGSAGVLEALALAGGATEYADRDRIFVLRRVPGKGTLRVRFAYAKLAAGVGRGSAFPLATGDVVTVE